MRPLGLKAQVVAFDRELCVVDQEEIQRLLDEHGDGVKSHGQHDDERPGTRSRNAPISGRIALRTSNAEPRRPDPE